MSDVFGEVGIWKFLNTFDFSNFLVEKCSDLNFDGDFLKQVVSSSYFLEVVIENSQCLFKIIGKNKNEKNENLLNLLRNLVG